ncbi:serine hydrolase [Streptomyces sp. SID9727]|uniref:serine hydrolase n=1 Tax=Streptomyces sp. SID9727 TaxID=2706114 RepID=UPI0013C6D826|nr:D-alanyl-D-alanine carboxypeptidase [Streptomyces sp. SID9727]
MAGESPDKSEQQQSSGTTRNERDPRLDVFRERTGGDSVPEAGADSATDAGSGSAAGADSVTGAGSAARADSGTDAGSDSGSDAGTAEEPASADAAGEPDAGPDEDAGAAPEAAESAPKAAEAPETAPESPEETADGPEAATDAPGTATDAPEAATDAPEAGEAAEAAGPGEGDARLRAAVAAWVSTADEGEKGTDEADAPDEEPRVPRSREEEPEEKPGTGKKPEPATAAEPEPEPAAEAESPADNKPADNKPAADKPAVAAAAEAAESAAAEPADDDASGGKKPADEPPVDQPTAVFKAPRLPKVDQPTTALKIKRSPSGEPVAAETESLTERTSQFVPLRSDDVRAAPTPAPRRPESPAPASGVPAPAALSGAERTRQQPMPPKPPLDLLAELTNTPPPPETPVRTAVRRVKIWTPLVLLLLLVFAIVQMVRPLPDPSLAMTAKETYTFGGGELKLDWPSQGQSAVTVDGVGSLGSSGAQKPAPIASVAKIMTAYVVLQGHPLSGKDEGEKITVDQQAEDESKAEDESTAPISKGQQFTEKQLLQLLMIPSGNNAARLFARWDSSSEAAFVEKMNDEAKKLGMTRTTYTDPSGLKKTTVSTAADQLKLARAVMKNEVFREIVDTPQIKIDGVDTMIYNNNTLLLKPGVSGIKTGSSTPAGGNLIWSANTVVDGKKLWIYGAVMGQQAGTGQPYDSLVMSLDNSLKLIEGAQAAVTSAKVVHKGDVVGYVDDGFGGRTPLVATADLKAKGWPGLKVELSVEGNGKKISRSMKAGTEVGVVTVGSGTGKVSAPVALQQDLSDPTFGQKLTRVG